MPELKSNLGAALIVVEGCIFLTPPQKLLWTKILTALCGSEEEKPETYEVGDRFVHDSGDNMKRWVLACVSGHDKVLLVNVDTGARFGSYVSVANTRKITEVEMINICQKRRVEFRRIWHKEEP